jgi:hypothetical protein
MRELPSLIGLVSCACVVDTVPGVRERATVGLAMISLLAAATVLATYSFDSTNDINNIRPDFGTNYVRFVSLPAGYAQGTTAPWMPPANAASNFAIAFATGPSTNGPNYALDVRFLVSFYPTNVWMRYTTRRVHNNAGRMGVVSAGNADGNMKSIDSFYAQGQGTAWFQNSCMLPTFTNGEQWVEIRLFRFPIGGETNLWLIDNLQFYIPNPPTLTALPAAPTDLVATAASSSRIDLKWRFVSPPTGGSEIGRWTGSIFGPPAVIARTGRTKNTYSDTGLSETTEYFYVVRTFTPDP